MNSLDIVNILNSYCINFGGVYAANKLNIIKTPSFNILNTDEFGKKGKHWIAMYINTDTCEFFDSLGKTPKYYHKYWHDFLIEKAGKYYYNNEQLQHSNSDLCGKYCIYYIIMRSQGVSFETVIEMLYSVDIEKFIRDLCVPCSITGVIRNYL